MPRYSNRRILTDEEVWKRIYDLKSNSLTIGEMYKDVQSIIIQIVDAYSKVRINESWTFTEDSMAFFYVDCKFSECYGNEKGFDLNSQINEAVRKKNESLRFKVDCGGYGDRGLQYSCDDFIEVEVQIQYRK